MLVVETIASWLIRAIVLPVEHMAVRRQRKVQAQAAWLAAGAECGCHACFIPEFDCD